MKNFTKNSMMSKTIKNEKDDTWRRKGHYHPQYKDDTCPSCQGTGAIVYVNDNGIEWEEVCPLCNGTGHYKP